MRAEMAAELPAHYGAFSDNWYPSMGLLQVSESSIAAGNLETCRLWGSHPTSASVRHGDHTSRRIGRTTSQAGALPILANRIAGGNEQIRVPKAENRSGCLPDECAIACS